MRQLKISEQAKAIAETLGEWAVPRKGRVAVMANQRHLWEELSDPVSAADANIAPRVLVLYAGETLRLPDESDCRRVDRQWQVVVVRGHGFKDPMSGGAVEPFTDSLESVRDIVRCMLGISDEEEVPSVRYKSMRPLPNIMKTDAANAFMDAMMLEFSTANDLAQVVLEAPGTEDTDGAALPP